VRRVLERVEAATLVRGTVVAVPIVNVFGFIEGTRYLPDRRDLNRSFPGSPRGSLAARLANLFMQEVVHRCTHGIDLHTAGSGRSNLPQIRANLEDPRTREVAEAFAAPVMMHATTRDGSLRQAAASRGVPVLLFEGGEPHRFNPEVIQVGVHGVLRVLRRLGMVDMDEEATARSVVVKKSRWLRARRGGLLRLAVKEGDRVSAGASAGTISDPFGQGVSHVRVPHDGIVIGHAQNPVVNQGDAVLHIGTVDPAHSAAS
jgi:predicted deacylase